jgi:hypothetical protein
LEDGNRFDYQHSLHPFFDRLIREEDVDGLAGAPIRLPKYVIYLIFFFLNSTKLICSLQRYVPVDVLQIPARVNNFEDALSAIRYCDKMCTLISVQAHTIKNINFLKVSLIEHTFIHVSLLNQYTSSNRYPNRSYFIGGSCTKRPTQSSVA